MIAYENTKKRNSNILLKSRLKSTELAKSFLIMKKPEYHMINIQISYSYILYSHLFQLQAHIITTVTNYLAKEIKSRRNILRWYWSQLTCWLKLIFVSYTYNWLSLLVCKCPAGQLATLYQQTISSGISLATWSRLYIENYVNPKHK